MAIELGKEARKEAVASIEVHEDEFQYWRRYEKARRGKG